MTTPGNAGTRRINLTLGALIAVLLGVGATLGYVLSGYQRLFPYKLLNIAGIVYGLVGVVVLSEMVAQSDHLKKFMIRWVGGVLIWAHTIVPIGALVGAGLGYDRPSAAITAKFSLSFFAYSVLVLTVVDFAVVSPQAERRRPLSSRTQAFGLILLVSGLVVQLIAAVQDFNG
ncbi:hypothetical protein [Trinickia mobilis]|uniref:hypothetical protein n=1 Tax=Trinickia mobilis TaxID=2816356 RepID=UPI001A8EC956|nr:hypothetical protein [Trinickia mobilis]